MKHALLALTLTAASAGALAQVGEHGRISTRSDVRMSIEGMSGTGGSKLDALAKTLGKPLGDVRKCYAELVKEHPDVVGTLAVELVVPEGKAPAKAKVADPTPQLKPMERCIDRAFGKLDVSDVPRPAGARVLLELTNSSASTADDVREHEEAASSVKVNKLPDGSFESRATSTQGELSFRVLSRDADGPAVVTRVHQGVRDALPALFDCRRKAGKKESPEGDVVLSVSLRPQAEPNVDVSSCTVKSDKAPACVDKALTEALMRAGKGKAEVTIHFTP